MIHRFSGCKWVVMVAYLVSYFALTPAFAQTISRDKLPQNTPGQQDSIPSLSEVKNNEPKINVSPLDQRMSQTGFDALKQQIMVHIVGDVSSPGVYKVSVSDRLTEVLKIAGLKRPSQRMIYIGQPQAKNRAYDLYQYLYYGSLEHNPFLSNNDVIVVPKQTGAVRIEGPVARPGIYELAGEKNLFRIVRLAGGFTSSMSKMHPVKVVRFEDGGKKLVLDVVQTESGLKNFKIQKGDIIIVPDVINAGDKFDYSSESIPGENIVYPTSVPDVFIIGAVLNPGPYPYKSHLTIKDYLGYAGASADANMRTVKVFRNGKKSNYNMFARAQAGDVVYVKEKNLELFLKYVSVVATVVSVTTSIIVFKEFIQNR